MNGKAAKRIRRAAVKTAHSRKVGPEKHREIEKELKKEYKALPYHRRKITVRLIPVGASSHREQRIQELG